MKRSTVLLFVLFSVSAFAQQRVFNLNNTQDTLDRYELGIVTEYPNCRTEDEDSAEFNLFYNALSSVNSELVRFVRQNDFDFKTQEKKIYIMHKYYVNEQGKIEHCAFMAHSELNRRIQRQYAKLLEKFIKGRIVNFESQTPYSICGQTVYRLKDGKLLGPKKK